MSFGEGVWLSLLTICVVINSLRIGAIRAREHHREQRERGFRP